MNELLEMFIKVAQQEAAQQSKKGGTNCQTPPKPTVDVTKEAQEAAKSAKSLYDAFLGAGFTIEQSFEITKNIMTPVKRA